MKKPTTTDTFSPPPQPGVTHVLPRNRMEVIRFETRENLVKAMGVFRQVASSDIHFTFRGDWPEDMCVTNTATVRALQALGVKFNWLTEHLPAEQCWPPHPRQAGDHQSGITGAV